MLFDVENQLCDDQDFTGSATVSENSYAKGTAAQDISIGRRMAIAAFFTAAGAGTTHTLEAIQADDAALTSNVEVLGSVEIDTDDLTLGYPVEVPIPQGKMDKKYLGLRHSASGGTTTATIEAFLVPQDEIAAKKVSFPKVIDAEV